MSRPDPVVDARRSAELHAELVTRARSWIPAWHTSGEAADFGSALLRIAARFGAEVTERLDRVPAKAGLDLLDWLHITGLPGQAARMPVVLRMADSSTDGVDVPARIRLQADVGDASVAFETTDAVRLVPSPIAQMVAVDSERDAIYYPAPNVLSQDAPAAGPQAWQLQSFAPWRARMLQLTPAIGLAAGTIVLAGGREYSIVAPPSGGLTAIEPPLENGGGETPDTAQARAADGLGPTTPVLAVRHFTPFGGSARDQQEHGLYIGDANALNLTAPARIGLSDPALPGADLSWAYWGKTESSGPQWHPLTPHDVPGAGLTLEKTDNGTVEMLEIDGRNSRWIRATRKPHTSLPRIELTQLALTLNAPLPAPPLPAEARAASAPQPPESDNVVSIESMPALEGVANNTSVPLNPDPFYPLGKIPRQFDSFYLACPEVFSKPEATTTLALSMAEPALGPLAAASVPGTGVARIVGVGADGSLHRYTWSKNPEPRLAYLGPIRPARATQQDTPQFKKADASMPPVLHVTGDQLQLALWSENKVWIWQERLAEPPIAGSWQFCGSITDAADATILQVILLGSGASATPPMLVALVQAKAVRALYMAPLQANATWTRLGAGSNWARLTPILDLRSGVPGASMPASFFAINAMGQLSRFDPGASGSPVGADIKPATFMATQSTPLAVRTGSATVLIGEAPRTNGTPTSLGAITFTDDGVDVKGTRTVQTEGQLVGNSLALHAGAPAPILTISSDQTPLTLLFTLRIKDQPPTLAWWEPALDEQPTMFDAPLASDGVLAQGPLLVGEHVLVPEQRRDVLAAALAALTRSFFVASDTLFVDALRSAQPRNPEDLVKLADGRFAALGRALRDPVVGYLYLADGEIEGSSARVFPDQPDAVFAAHAVSKDKLRLISPFLRIDAASILLLAYTDESGALVYSEHTIIHNGQRTNKVELRRSRTVGIAPDLPRVAVGQDLSYMVYAIPGSPDIVNCPVHPTLALRDPPVTPATAELIAGSRRMHLSDSGVKPQDQTILAVAARSGEKLAILGNAWTARPSQPRFTVRVAGGASVWSHHSGDVRTNPDLSWEYWNGVGWWKIKDLTDGTANLKRSGDVVFQVPVDLAPTEVLGRSSHWIRARLVGGDFGRESFVISTRPAPEAPDQQQQSVTINTDQVHAPVVVRITIAYRICTPTRPTFLLTRDSGAWRDQSDANRSAEATVQAFVPVGELLAQLAAPAGRALYLVFRKRLVGSPIRILFLANDNANHDQLAPLRVEALRNGRFEPVTVQDGTRALGESGVLTLSLDSAPTESELFGVTGFWLRVAPHDAAKAGSWQPSLRGVYANALWAEAAQSQEMEVLGASDGAPGQRFSLSHFPVLADTLELRVREPLGEEEQHALLHAAHDAVRSDVTGYPGHWVRWTEVADPADEAATARVYGLDFASGEVRFGDGVHGAVPPVGRDAVMAFGYRHGGAQVANAVDAFARLNLATPIEGVQAAFAPERAAGGADPESVDTVRRFSSTKLRARGRAVTLLDLEQLALGATAQIAQARALLDAGGIKLVVVARDTEPQAGQGLRRELLARLLRQAGPACARRLRIAAPLALVRFRITLRLRVASLDVSGALGAAAKQAVAALFNHVSGGPDGFGWPIGMAPSDMVVAARLVRLPDLEGIEHITFSVERDNAPPAPAASSVSVKPDQLAWLLADGVTIVFTTGEIAS